MRVLALACSAIGGVAPALAQDTGAADGAAAATRLSIVPSVSASVTASDNLGLDERRDAGLVTTAGAGLRVNADRGGLRGFLDYSATAAIYTKAEPGTDADNELINRLAAVGTAELIDRRLFLDGSATVSQQSVSPFGRQSAEAARPNDNRAEVATLTLSPSLRGRFPGAIDYEARFTASATRSDADELSDQNSASAVLSLGQRAVRGLGWSALASRQTVDFSEGRRTESDRVEGELTYAFNEEFALSVLGGREANDFRTLDKESYGFSGIKARWVPGPRTTLSAERRNRFFGSSHAFTFSHRTPLTVWTYTDARDVSSGFDQPTTASLGPIYDLLFRQFESQYPDPVLRAAAVNDFLRRNGIDPGTQVSGAFLTSAITLDRRARLAVALLGVRSTLTVGATYGSSRRLDTVSSATDPLAGGNEVRQRGLDATVAHRLTPLSSLSASGHWQRNDGDGPGQATSLKTVSAGWSTVLGPRASASLSGRWTHGYGTGDRYIERAVTGSFAMTF